MIRSKIAMGFLWHCWRSRCMSCLVQSGRRTRRARARTTLSSIRAAFRSRAQRYVSAPCLQAASLATPLALIYSDGRATQALANPTTTDASATISSTPRPGKYEIENLRPAITTKQFPT